MFGRLGWHGQCGCCNGPREKRQEKMSEEKQWRDEFEEEIDPIEQELIDLMMLPVDDFEPECSCRERHPGMLHCWCFIGRTSETSGVLYIPDTMK